MPQLAWFCYAPLADFYSAVDTVAKKFFVRAAAFCPLSRVRILWAAILARPKLVTNAIERLHEEFKRRIKTQTVLPSAETAAMLFWALLASGQITMRKVDGWESLAEKPSDQIIDLAA